jgi:NAD(P)-dependent dehydrogenase (short-subunit alcohol dehydrogenase family)
LTVHWTPADIPDQSGRVALVTGANSGLGYQVALGLAVAGAEVVLACRNPDKAESARASILVVAPAATVSLIPLDLGDLASVAACAATVRSTHDRLDLLINNAGLMAVDQSRTVDGFEIQLGVNHLGHFALTEHLLPVITATPGARVASMSSLAHRAGRLDLEDLMFDRRRYGRWQAYCQSKLANLLFALELQRRLTASGAAAIAVTAHPGVAHTNLGSQYALSRWMMRASGPVNSSAASGALPMLRAATDPAVLGGQFYGPAWTFSGHPVLEIPSQRARDEVAARALWDVSAELTRSALLPT